MPQQRLDKFKEDLLSRPLDRMMSLWLFETVPFVFNGEIESHVEWKHRLAEKIGVDFAAITVIGSASLGFSTNPGKNYSFFAESSDIDVAIISDYHFTVSWRYLRNLGSVRHGMPAIARNSIDDHVNRLIYWGTIASDKLLAYLPFGNEWGAAFDALKEDPCIAGRTINARIYRDFDSLRSYQLLGFRSLQKKELGGI